MIKKDGTTNNIDNLIDNKTGRISVDWLFLLWYAGFKLVPTFSDGIPNVDGLVKEEEFSRCPLARGLPVRVIYLSPDFWSKDRIKQEAWRFEGVATVCGKTFVRNEKGNIISKLYQLYAADLDSESAFRLCQLKLENEYMQNTFVTKTRKQFGYHFFWLEEIEEIDDDNNAKANDNNHVRISKTDCKSADQAVEIMTGLHYISLPPSKYRDDPSFRYKAIGHCNPSLKIMVANGLYDKLVNETFRGLINKETVEKRRKQQRQDDSNSVLRINHLDFITLREQQIRFIASWISQFYTEGNRNDIMLPFMGALFYSGISVESADKITTLLCSQTGDFSNESKWRQLLNRTYAMGSSGLPATGFPRLTQLIQSITHISQEEAEKQIDTLKTNLYGEPGTPSPKDVKILSVSDAKMWNSGICAVRGKIMVCSGHFKMVSHTTYQCSNSKCNYHAKIRHPRPLISTTDKEINSKCPKCLKSTASANFVYTNSVWVELQDVDMPNEIDRMVVYLFEENTRSLKVGETVVIDGNICVIHKNENYRNKFISVLFGHSIRYESRQNISLSKQHIQQIHTLREKYGDGWLEYLVSEFAPNIAGDYYYPKLGLLLSAASSGPDKIFRKRDRIHTLLVGDAGLAKSVLLYDATLLVPGSKYMSMSNTSGISLTAMIEKDENGGGYNLRIGTIILAKNAMFAANEIGDLDFKQQHYLPDIMEEGVAYISKYTIDAEMVAPVTMIAACNPTGGTWKYPDRIELTEIPIPLKEIDRYDLIFVLRMSRDKETLDKLAEEIEKCEREHPLSIDYTLLQKIILYAKNFDPKIAKDACQLIKTCWTEIATQRGSIRIKNTLERLTKAIAKLKFKNIADREDAKDAISLYRYVISQYEEDITTSKDPKHAAVVACSGTLQKNSAVSFRVDQLIEIACLENEQVSNYFSGERRLKSSYKVQAVKDILLENPNIHQTSNHPVSLQWIEQKQQQKKELEDQHKPNYQSKTNEIGDSNRSSYSTTGSQHSQHEDTSSGSAKKESIVKEVNKQNVEQSGDVSDVGQVDFSPSKNIQGSNLPDDVLELSLNIDNEALSITKGIADRSVNPEEPASRKGSSFSHTYRDNATSPTSPSSPHYSISKDNNKNIGKKDVPNRPDRLRLDHSKHAHIYNNEDADNFDSTDTQEEQKADR